MSYKLGSLFDGSGGFPLAGALCGVEPVWASEVEPYPIAVARSRFPNMKHLGDISKTTRTPETVAEYKTMGRNQQSEIEDVGGFVGRSWQETPRQHSRACRR